ncbi:UDP-glucose 4-epimerase [Dendrothele bispora CBS 962.96]|uniref:UDP-glucose 4-epimerase n=1 Tax=Dendrothele bispora (strain CBS 962.96) TaxID=1314807 RepID=A0A4S8MTW6_DENBC|nr:UDP-glucose 4-epimerase [Dendrothele bispora CBS 962.96]
MNSLQSSFNELVKSLPPTTSSGRSQSQLDDVIKKALENTKGKYTQEVRRNQWEYILKNEVLKLAETEGKALKEKDESYYDKLRDQLDLILTFTENEICEQTFPFTILQDLLETQTIASCSHIFSWIELRAPRLTKDMVPQKGKALVLLRTLNDLLRRLSKTGNMTLFCGRILTFLSGVFPLGERSGVNLRGEYGPAWEGPGISRDSVEEVKREEKEGKDEVKEDAGDKMQVDEKESAKATPSKTSEQKEDFYNTFWSLQLPFSKPSVFVQPNYFSDFQEAVGKVLPVIKEATVKERAMMGSKAVVGSGSTSKRKRDAAEGEEESNTTEYFFAKYLTSPDLLDLEIADTHFRRQFLFQLLILLNHLLSFTKTAKSSWQTPRNRSLQMDFTLDTEEQQWVQDTISRAMDELRHTTPNGRTFAETVGTMLEREKNWIKWKNEMCMPFDKEPYFEEIEVADDDGQKKKRKVGLQEATKEIRNKMRESPPDWEHKYGSESLTEIWEMGYRDLRDLQNPFDPGDVKEFVKKIDLDNRRIDMRTTALRKQQERQQEAKKAAAATSAAPTPPPPGALSSASGGDVEMKPPEAEAKTVPSSQETTSTSSPHPSLPAKPGSSTEVPKLQEANPGTADVTMDHPTTDVKPVVSAPAPPPPLPKDGQITKAEESKQRWSWLALRTARDQYLSHFGKIGTGDVMLLVQEIEKEKKEKEKGSLGTKVEEKADGEGDTRRFKVITIDNYHNSLPAAITRVGELARDELPSDATEQDKESTVIDSHSCDLTKSEQVRAVFEKYGKGGIWGVVHIAAYKAVGESTEIPLTYYQNNVSATLSLLQIMSEFDCTRIVYSSSATVYGTPPIVPIPETTRLQADSPYGKTKVMAETIIDDLCHADSRWQALSLRYFNPAGAHPSGRIGEDPKGRPGNLLPLLAHMAVGRVKESVLKVFGNDYPTPDGTCVRDYLHVLDLASGHLLALDALSPDSKLNAFGDRKDGAKYKAYNLGKGKGMSVLQIVEAMRKATGFDYKTEVIGRRRGDVPDLTADPALAEKELGFKAEKDLETMCKDLWNFQTKNPDGYE